MKKVKEICLGVAVAGVVAGAGSAVGVAVASAETESADSTATNQSEQSAAPVRGPARKATAARATRGSSVAAARPANDSPATDAAGSASTPRPAASTKRSVREPVVAVVTTAPSVEATERVVTVAAPAPAPTPAPAAPQAAPAAVSVAPRPVASVRVTRIAAGAAALTPAPVSPLAPVLPLTLPFSPALPVAPASTVSSAASTTLRGRQAASTAYSVVGDPAQATHVLVIGLDGVNLDKVLEYAYNPEAPEVDQTGYTLAMKNGVTGATSIVGHTTISGPSWSTILTGAWDNKTGVINNIFSPRPYDSWPTVFNLIEYNDPAIDTAIVADWKYMVQMANAGGYPVDNGDTGYVPQIEGDDDWSLTDAEVRDKVIDLINATTAAQSTFVMSYLVQVDEVGHAFGGGSQEYIDAVIRQGENVKQILDAVYAWNTDVGQGAEEWSVIITTDHGHQQSAGFGHGFQSPNETASFIMFDQEGDDTNDGKQNLGYSNVDITPTILGLFGLPERSDFDGVSLVDNKLDSIVDPVDLKQGLLDAIAMRGYPNIGTDIALGIRTVFGAIPYFLNIGVESLTDTLAGIAGQDIFLISALAGVTEFVVGAIGDVLVGITQFIAQGVGWLTGAGRIAPTDPPLPAPPANSEFVGGQLILT